MGTRLANVWFITQQYEISATSFRSLFRGMQSRKIQRNAAREKTTLKSDFVVRHIRANSESLSLRGYQGWCNYYRYCDD